MVALTSALGFNGSGLSLVLSTMLLMHCAQGSSTPAAPPPVVDKNAATSGSDATQNKSGLSGLAGIGGPEKDDDVRTRQLSRLNTDLNDYRVQMQYYSQYRFTLLKSVDSNEATKYRAQVANGLAPAAEGAAIGVGGTLLAGAATGGLTPTQGGNGFGSAVSSAGTAAGTAIAGGLGADHRNAGITTGLDQIIAEMKTQIAQYDAIIAALQTKIDLTTTQIKALNAQKLKL